MFLASFMYDDSGNPIWYAASPMQMKNATTCLLEAAIEDVTLAAPDFELSRSAKLS